MRGGRLIDLDRLIACALGEVDDDEVELHALACDDCAARFAVFARLPAAIGALVRSASAAFPATRSLVARLDAEHLISRRYVLAPGSIVPCTVGTADILSLSVFEVPGAPAEVDLERGPQRFTGVPVDAGSVYLVTPSAAVRLLPTQKIPFRISSGGQTLAEYTLDHTALHSPP